MTKIIKVILALWVGVDSAHRPGVSFQ
jgi:hypothetical protein